MGTTINTDQWERFPSVSPGGKYLFFNRGNGSANQVYWVSAAIIDSLRTIRTGIPIKEGTGSIRDFRLNQNYPNPFNSETTIGYHLPESGHVVLCVYDALGRKVKTLVDSYQNAGEHSIVWNSTNANDRSVSSGTYFCRLIMNDLTLQNTISVIQ